MRVLDRRHVLPLSLFAAVLICGAPRGAQAQIGTAFTYQGLLNDGGVPANDVYDLRFTLFTAGTGGAPVGVPFVAEDVSVQNGLFTVRLDFGPVFTGSARWLETAVRPGTGGTFEPLVPRQELTPVPGAVFAANAATIGGLACGDGQVAKWNGGWSCGMDADGQAALNTHKASGDHDTRYVLKAGDTMTGVLALPADGLVAGSDQLVLAGGRVGIRRAAPQVGLHVRGNTFFDLSGAGAAERNVTIKTDGQAQINFGSFPGAWTSSLQIQNNDNTRHLWMSPIDSASGASARIRSAGTGLDVYVGGTTSNAGTQALQISDAGVVRKPNQPWFIAGHSVGAYESCPTGGGWIEAPYDTVGGGNAGGWYNPANGRFTAPVTGLYMFVSSHYIYASAGAPSYMHHQIGVNGAATGGGGRAAPDYNILGLGPDEGTYSMSPSVTRLLFLSAGDYVSVWVYCGSSGVYRYGNFSYFAGHLIH